MGLREKDGFASRGCSLFYLLYRVSICIICGDYFVGTRVLLRFLVG